MRFERPDVALRQFDLAEPLAAAGLPELDRVFGGRKQGVAVAAECHVAIHVAAAKANCPQPHDGAGYEKSGRNKPNGRTAARWPDVTDCRPYAGKQSEKHGSTSKQGASEI